MKDYYAILGVARTATADEIKQAYRHLAWKYHPDRNVGNAAAEDFFKQLTEAYFVLSDVYKRSDYDFRYEKTHQNVNAQWNNRQSPPKEPERKATTQSYYTTSQQRNKTEPKKPFTIHVEPKSGKIIDPENKGNFKRKILNIFGVASAIVVIVTLIAFFANLGSRSSSNNTYNRPPDGDLTNAFQAPAEDKVLTEMINIGQKKLTDYLKRNPGIEYMRVQEEFIKPFIGKLEEKARNGLSQITDKNILDSKKKKVQQRMEALVASLETMAKERTSSSNTKSKKPLSVNPVKAPILTAEEKLLLEKNEWIAEGWAETKVNTGNMPACYNFTPKRSDDIDNYLEVHVGGNTDVVIKVMSLQTNKWIRYVFVNSHSTYKIRNIPEGKYYLKIAYGKDWFSKVENGQCIGRFLRNKIYEKGEDILDFTVQETEDGYSIPYFELHLDVIGVKSADTFDSYKISEDEFNK
jgi:curved DNA-binding protein CbpA